MLLTILSSRNEETIKVLQVYWCIISILSLDKDNLFKAYVSSYMYIIDDNTVLANKIVSILEMKLFQNLKIVKK